MEHYGLPAAGKPRFMRVVGIAFMMKKLLLVAGFMAAFLVGYILSIVVQKFAELSSTYSVSLKGCHLLISIKSPDEPFPLERLFSVAKEDGSPIRYDRKTCEFEILHPVQTESGTTTGGYPMAYCPFTGRPLGSGRGFLFMEITEAEVRRLWLIVENAKDMNDIVAKLGKPDSSYGETKYFKAQYTFTNVSDTADLSVVIEHDGRLTPIIGGKQIRDSVMKNDSNQASEAIGTQGAPQPQR